LKIFIELLFWIYSSAYFAIFSNIFIIIIKHLSYVKCDHIGQCFSKQDLYSELAGVSTPKPQKHWHLNIKSNYQAFKDISLAIA